MGMKGVCDPLACLGWRPPQTARAPAATRSTATARAAGARRPMVVRAAAATSIQRAAVPLELEKGEMPLNTFNNKAPFKATIKSVQRIVGPKATGETCHIIIETKGDIPFWEGQSYGVIPPVSRAWRGTHTTAAIGRVAEAEAAASGPRAPRAMVPGRS